MQQRGPPDPEFGSEVRRLETPEHRKQRRRKGITAAMVGVVLGGGGLALGISAIRSGELVRGPSGTLPVTGEVACAMGLFVLVISGWLLWRFLTVRQ